MHEPGDEDDRKDAEIEAEEQLMLADEGEPLPWLESDDDYVEPGFDWRIVIYGVVGLLVVIGLVGGVGWLVHRGDQAKVVADGSTIKAPPEPYKTKPANPGGATMPGTGDVSYEVGEGQSVNGKVAEQDVPVPAPSIDRNQSAAATPTPAASPAASSGVGVQVGAYTTRASAEAGWRTLQVRYPPLKGQQHRIVEGTVDGGTIYRLQAVTDSVSAANSLCHAVKAVGGDCQVRR